MDVRLLATPITCIHRHFDGILVPKTTADDGFLHHAHYSNCTWIFRGVSIMLILRDKLVTLLIYLQEPSNSVASPRSTQESRIQLLEALT